MVTPGRTPLRCPCARVKSPDGDVALGGSSENDTPDSVGRALEALGTGHAMAPPEDYAPRREPDRHRQQVDACQNQQRSKVLCGRTSYPVASSQVPSTANVELMDEPPATPLRSNHESSTSKRQSC